MGVASRPQTPAHTHPAMDTVTIKDIPREMLIKDSLKGELLGDRKLRPTEAAEKKEKISLPGAEEIQTERTILGLLQGVADFEADTLRTVKTREPASPSSIVKTVLARDSSLTAVNEFDKTCLKKAETAEKNPLPSSEAIAQEMEHIKFKVGIEMFDKTKLSHTETLVKDVLPAQVFTALEMSQ